MAKNALFKPMLSARIDDVDDLRDMFPLLGSTKLDGVRATVQHGQVLSRKQKLIPNRYVQQLFGRHQLNGCDGELIVGSPIACDSRTGQSIVFRTTSSAVMRKDGQPQVTFWLFDKYDPLLAFHKRYEQAARLIRLMRPQLPNWPFDLNRRQVVQSALQRVVQTQVNSMEELLALEKSYLALGYEGVMLRDPFGKYKQGRSTLREGWLMKLKRFKDGEARILEVVELLHNDNVVVINELGHKQRSSHKANKRPGGVAGALRVQDLKTKQIFNVGGLDNNERQSFWDFKDEAVGKIIRYKYLPIGIKDKPRHPVFDGLRDKRDL